MYKALVKTSVAQTAAVQHHWINKFKQVEIPGALLDGVF